MENRTVPCMLSEFDLPILRWLLRSPGAAFWSALLALSLATITWSCGKLAGTNGMAVHFNLVDARTGGAMITTVTHVYGYMGEPNHGWFFFVGLPIFLATWFYCLQSLSSAFEELAKRGLLVPKASACDEIASQNRVLMRPVILLIPTMIIALTLLGEYRSLHSLRHGYNEDNIWDFGHIQARHIEEWRSEFNTKQFDGAPNANMRRWEFLKDKYVRASLEANSKASKGAELATDHDMETALQDGKVTINATRSGGPVLNGKRS